MNARLPRSTPELDLPILLRHVAEDCGEEAALDFSERLGGLRLSAPHALEGSCLEEQTGVAVAASLVSRFPGEYVVVPQIADRLRAARRRIYVAARPNAAPTELAQALRMSLRGVQLIRQRLRRQSGAA